MYKSGVKIGKLRGTKRYVQSKIIVGKLIPT